jgi:hypothetical protein
MILVDWLKERGACKAALAWVRESGAETPAEAVTACPCGGWLLWVAEQLGYPHAQLKAALRPAQLRALREYAPTALDAEGMRKRAQQFREFPDDVSDELAAGTAAWARGETPYQASGPMAYTAVNNTALAWWMERAGITPSMAADCVASAAKAALAAVERRSMRYSDSEAEHARCAAEVRAALPDLAARWSAAMEVKQ